MTVGSRATPARTLGACTTDTQSSLRVPHILYILHSTPHYSITIHINIRYLIITIIIRYKMAPPPRPPVICYDLFSGAPPRRQRRYLDTGLSNYVPPVATTCSTYRTQNTLPPANTFVPKQVPVKVIYNDSEHGVTQSTNNCGSGCFMGPTSRAQQPPSAIFAGPGNAIFGSRSTNPQTTRLAYSQKLRSGNQRRERPKEEEDGHQSLRNLLETILLELNAVKKVQESMGSNYGTAHNAAKYIQMKEEENAELRRKIDKYHELLQTERQKLLQQKEKEKEKELEVLRSREQVAEKKLMKDLSDIAHYRENMLSSTINGSISPLTSDLTDSPQLDRYQSRLTSEKQHSSCRGSQGSSSTLSISPSSSSSPSSSQYSMHITSSTPAKRFLPNSANLRNNTTHIINKPRQNIPQRSILSSSKNRTRVLPKSNTSAKSIQFSTPIIPRNGVRVNPHNSENSNFHDARFNFDQSTLEITDTDFFQYVEDPTMMEMNALMDRLVPQLNQVKQL